MNLLVDIGNTRIKAAVFDGNELLQTFVFDTINELIDESDLISDIKNCGITSVTSEHESFLNKLPSNIQLVYFNFETKIPIKNCYKSPLTLGTDRLIASVGSFGFFPNQNVLTIDAGTCIKYNFVNNANEFLGGAISPGISMRLKAMNQFTHALPLVEFDRTYNSLVGTDTQQSLLSGALMGTIAEVDEMINNYFLKYPNLQVVLTGGDSDYLGKQLKSRLFANQNLLLYGLNTILNYNLEK